MSVALRFSGDFGQGDGDPVTGISDGDATAGSDAGILAAEIVSSADAGSGRDWLAFETGFGEGSVVVDLLSAGVRVSQDAASVLLTMLAGPA